MPTHRLAGRGTAVRSPVLGRHGMVAASQPLAAGAGVEILRKGGSAVDAAIAVNACLSLMEPTACGPGGDLFAIVRLPGTGELVGLNASGRAPFSLQAEKVPPGADGTIGLHTPWAWTVPGCVDGWAELHSRFGKLRLAEVLEPAIGYAVEGFPVSPVIASDWKRGAGVFGKHPGFAEVFLPGGDPPEAGSVFRNAGLARTLRWIADGGRDAYYRGAIAETLLRYSRKHGGSFTVRDFERHTSSWVEPLTTNYRGLTVAELPPPGQGLAALQLLDILETFDLRTLGRESADFWHIMVEAKKLAYADRARYYADPEFAAVPVEELLSKRYSAGRAARIDPGRAALIDPPGEVRALNRPETTYLCAADASGLMVSLIQSNYTGFGSGYVVPELGFGLQNRGALFALAPGHPNRLEPGKRPFHTIIPAFATTRDGTVIAFGLMGGDMQPQGHAQVIVNLVDFDMSLQEAGDAIRFHHTGSSEPTGTVMREGGILHIEAGLAEAVLADLRRRGHVLESEPVGAYGGYQAIARDGGTGVYTGATERRKDGCAAGY